MNYPAEYDDRWPPRTDRQLNKQIRLKQKYHKAFILACRNGAPGKKLRRHIYWLRVFTKLYGRLFSL